MKKEIKINLSDSIVLKDSILIKKESNYLIISNKEKCKNLLINSPLSSNDIVDILISLHIVLEVSLNTLYRHLISAFIKKDVDEFEIMNNIDNIGFIDKTIMFIYNSKFNFNNKLKEATKYHSIISALRDFSGVRNKLLHGHSISTIFDGEKNRYSELKKILNPDFLKNQIKKFSFILEGMRFYLDCLDSGLTEHGKEQYKKSFLDDSFLPILRT
jgi:hypothetical protein